MPARIAAQYTVQEWSFESAKTYPDPFNQVELDVVVTGPAGEMVVPAFWAGGQEWRVRFAPPLPGRYTWKSRCSDPANADLHGRSGQIEAAAYCGDNPLLSHGPLGVSPRGHCLQFADGTPFLWTGDTWWLGFTSRLRWPEDVRELAADRLAKGFNLVQIIAGLYPDMPAFDPRGRNEVGDAWTEGFGAVNPRWYDLADLKLAYLVSVGLMPCVVGSWAYFLPWMGLEKVKRHWRNLVARWGAYPVVWCLAGEVGMPYYDYVFGPNANPEEAKRVKQMQRDLWPQVGRYVRSIDPYHRPITIHPSNASREEIADPGSIDFEMLQSSHGGYSVLPNLVKTVARQVALRPAMPVVQSEVNYEGLMEASAHSIRIAYWASMLGGCAGFTYGANGIWQMNGAPDPYGNSPWGGTWGNTPWREAYRCPGSTHIGIGRRLLERFAWAEFRPHQEWISNPATPEKPQGNYCAGIANRVRIAYLPHGRLPWAKAEVLQLEKGVRYSARFVNPQTGQEHPLPATTGEDSYTIPVAPITHDWLLVMEAKG